MLLSLGSLFSRTKFPLKNFPTIIGYLVTSTLKHKLSESF